MTDDSAQVLAHPIELPESTRERFTGAWLIGWATTGFVFILAAALMTGVRWYGLSWPWLLAGLIAALLVGAWIARRNWHEGNSGGRQLTEAGKASALAEIARKMDLRQATEDTVTGTMYSAHKPAADVAALFLESWLADDDEVALFARALVDADVLRSRREVIDYFSGEARKYEREHQSWLIRGRPYLGPLGNADEATQEQWSLWIGEDLAR